MNQYSRLYTPEEAVERLKKRRAKARTLRQAWIAANGPCKHCGTWERLQIDHIDPRLKTMESGNIFKCTDEERRKHELANCQPLCAPCHARKTFQDVLAGRSTGNHSLLRTSCYRWHEYTTENTYFAKDEPTARRCRTCRRESNRATKRRSRARNASRGDSSQIQKRSLR